MPKGKKGGSHRPSRRSKPKTHRAKPVGFFRGLLRTIKREGPATAVVLGLGTPLVMEAPDGWTPIRAATSGSNTLSGKLQAAAQTTIASFEKNWKYPAGGIVVAIVAKKARKYVG